MKQHQVLIPVVLLFVVPQASWSFSLGPVVECTLGHDCYIQQYVDHDASDSFSDYRCEGLSYDGHKGTDFALISRRQMEAGVNVLAAADGEVIAIRDGVQDKLYTRENRAEISGKECGNGVVIRHQEDWTTQYCHLKRGSVRVKKGDMIASGERLGEIGLSGKTQFPHLHLTVRNKSDVVDPFRPNGRTTCAEVLPDETLWNHSPPYRPGGLLSVGFTEAIPDYQKLKAGDITGTSVSLTSPALVLYGLGYGFRKGDIIEFNIKHSQKIIFTHQSTLKKSQIQGFQAAGLKRRSDKWAAGPYEGAVSLIRDSKVIDQRTIKITF